MASSHSAFSVVIHIKIYAFALLFVATLISCGTAPDKARHENGWTVVENQCEDVLVQARTKLDYGSGEGSRVLLMSDTQNRKIYQLEVFADSSGNIFFDSTSYQNTGANEIAARKRLPKSSDIDAALFDAYDNFYDQPGKHENIDLQCILRGMNYGT